MKKPNVSARSLFAAFLAVCLLCSAIACTGNGKDEKGTGDASASASAAGPEGTAETEKKRPSLPDVKYDGETFTFLVRGAGNEWDCVDIFMNVDRVSDKILNRNYAIEQKYGLAIEQVQCSVDEYTKKIEELSLVNDDSVDVYVCSQYGLHPSAMNGYLLDMNELPYNDFSAPYWDDELNTDLTLGGHRYYAVSSMNLMAYYATWVITYNMQVFEDLGYDINEPYQLVRDGKWTLDAYAAYQKNFTRDLDSDNRMTEADQWGTAGQSDHILGLLYGAGYSLLSKDEEDMPVLVEANPSILSVISKITELCKKNVGFDSHDGTVNTQYSSNGEYGRTMFAENRAMFFHETLKAVSTLRDMNSNFGVVPSPKADEKQDSYYSMVHYWAMSMNAVPAYHKDTEKVSIILEEMAYESAETVVPEFLFSSVYGKYLRGDDASYEMMDYVNENRFIDFGIVTNIGGIIGVVKTGIYDGSLNYARITDAAKSGVAAELDAMRTVLTGGEDAEAGE